LPFGTRAASFGNQCTRGRIVTGFFCVLVATNINTIAKEVIVEVHSTPLLTFWARAASASNRCTILAGDLVVVSIIILIADFFCEAVATFDETPTNIVVPT
jgi:hypothetical protein